ncbi:MAG: ribosome silencing factor [Chloroflexi bacterium]|nr:ribosome silencing factor [Chloroflexota bacterium]
MVDLIAGKMGSDIVLLDLTGITIIADYFIIATGDSERQLKGIADELQEQLKTEFGIQALSVEGTPSSGWVLLDYGNIVVHLFSEAMRSRYQLEELWQDAKPLVRLA